MECIGISKHFNENGHRINPEFINHDETFYNALPHQKSIVCVFEDDAKLTMVK